MVMTKQHRTTGTFTVAARLEQLLDQLTYSVDHFRGKTTITDTDISILRDALKLIK